MSIFTRGAAPGAGLLAFALLLFGVEGGSSQEQELVTMSLDEAVARALVRSPAVLQGENAVHNAEQTRRTNFGSYLPSLSASSSTSRGSSSRFDPNLNRNVTGNSESYSMSMSTGVDLFTGFRRGAEMDRARADILAAESRLEDQRFQIALQTKNQYFQALRQSDLLEVARARLARAEESLEFTRRRAEAGTGTRSDTLRARLEVQNARQAVLTSESSLRAARLNLGRLVGVEGPVGVVRPEGLDPSPLPYSEEELLRMAQDASPSVRAARAGTVAAQAAYRSARSAYMPTLRTSGSYSWNNSEPSWETGRTAWSMSLNLSYPIFNGFSREASVERAANAERLARIQEEDARLQARVQVDNALRALETAEAAIALAEETLVVAEEDMRVVQQRYELGVATILDVITSQIALDQAQVDRVTARYDYVVARSQLAALLGIDL